MSQTNIEPTSSSFPNSEEESSTSKDALINIENSNDDESDENENFYDLSPVEFAESLIDAQNKTEESLMNGLERLIFQQRL
jgi:hypothetical protein